MTMVFEFVLTKQARDDLGCLDATVAKRIVKKLLWWQKQTDPLSQAKRLIDSAAGDVCFRLGDYRLIALVNEKKSRIEVVKIGHRRDIYK